jgi:hypothetical protein
MREISDQPYNSKQNASVSQTLHDEAWKREHPLPAKDGQASSDTQFSPSERDLRVKTALQAVVPTNEEEMRGSKLIKKGQEEQSKAHELETAATKEKPDDANDDRHSAADIMQKANCDLDKGCTSIELSSGYCFERFDGQLSIAYKALPVEQEDIDRLRREAEMRDPLGERVLRTAGRVAKSTGDFAKGVAYGALAWPDIAEYQLSDKRTARQWGYMAGGLVNLSPVPFLPTMTEGIGLAAHIVHGVHQHELEKEAEGPDQADIARRAKEMRDPLGVRIDRTMGRVSRSVGDFTKATFYGSLSLPDKGENPPDDMPSARQLGYAVGHLTLTTIPVPFASLGTNLFGMGAHVIHDANQKFTGLNQSQHADNGNDDGKRVAVASIGSAEQNRNQRKKNTESSKENHDLG